VGARGAPISLGASNDGDSDSLDEDESKPESSNMEQPEDSSPSESEKEEEGEIPEVGSDSDDKFPARKSSLLDVLESYNGNFSTLVPKSRVSEDLWKVPTPKTKRVLSSNTLAALNAGYCVDSPKRLRPNLSGRKPDFSLGLAAMDGIRPLPRQFLMRDSPIMSSDDEDLDKRLSEELERKSKDDRVSDNSPVPLLTPPQSPLTIDIGEGGTTFCEWPSNLVVDTAMTTAATDTRPLSPASLQKFEEAEEERLAKGLAGSISPETSSLTPLLRSIYVGID
jgi:hypothetical protein